jgi:hypothetical protein
MAMRGYEGPEVDEGHESAVMVRNGHAVGALEAARPTAAENAAAAVQARLRPYMGSDSAVGRYEKIACEQGVVMPSVEDHLQVVEGTDVGNVKVARRASFDTNLLFLKDLEGP